MQKSFARKKIAEILREIVKRILFIGFGIQIVLGMIWMCLNLFFLQAFSVDWGIFSTSLYEKLQCIYLPVYLLQLCFAFGAGYVLFRTLLGRHQRIQSVYGSLGLLTFPFALQCHLAVSPYSLCFSVSLLFVVFLIRLCKGEQIGWNLARAFLCLAALALLSRIAFWAGWCSVVAVLVTKLVSGLRRKRMAWCGRLLLLFLTLSGCIFGGASLCRANLVPEASEVGSAVFCRICMPSLYKGENLLPGELWSAVGEYYSGAQITLSEFQETVCPGILEQYGRQRGTELFWEISVACLRLEWPYLVKQCVGDFLGNIFLPSWYQRQLEGRWYGSFLGRNYELFLMNTPKLSFLTAWYCMLGYPFCCFFVLVLFFVRKRTHGKSGFYGVILFALLCALLATLRGAGMLDGKETLVANQLLSIVAMFLMFSSGADLDEKEV